MIEDAKFQYIGCPASAACGSVVTQIIKRKSLQQIKKINKEVILEKLGGLPDNEFHCANLVLTTLRRAIKKYENIAKQKKGSIEF
jgi:nitrogen fixation NifU-like protein